MATSTGLFGRCLKWLGLGPARTGAARRRSTRYNCSLEAGCCLVANVEGDNWPATVRNISLDGLGMVVSRCYESGTRLRVTLHNPAKTMFRSLMVRVAYTMEHPSGEWIMGAAFARPLSAAELKSLLN